MSTFQDKLENMINFHLSVCKYGKVSRGEEISGDPEMHNSVPFLGTSPNLIYVFPHCLIHQVITAVLHRHVKVIAL